MKQKLIMVACLTVFIIITSFLSYLPMGLNVPSFCESREDFSQSAYDYMEIDTAEDFIANGWSGNGSESNPFVLEDKTLGSIGNYLYIRILDIDYYFEIRNCQLLLAEITFVSVSNGKINECTLVNSSISIDYSSYCDIIRSTFSYNLYDIGETIWMYESSHCEILQNQFNYGHTGIAMYACNDTIISDNTFIEFTYGAISPDLANTTLRNNIFENTGIRIEFWDTRIANNPPVLENNSVNGKDIGLFYNITETQIDADLYGQIILGNCTEITISGGTLVACTTGVQFLVCVNCTVDGTIISDCWQGMYIERSPRTRIVDCQVNNSLEEGIFLSQSPFYRIENCTLEDNLNGILPHIYSNNGTIVNCTIRGNRLPYLAIDAGVGLFLSNNSTAIGNTISENSVGLYIYGGHCLVVQNSITYNDYGICLGTAYDGYGERCYANRIYRNDIGWNDQANAYDGCYYYNEWDDGVGEGNGWSDYYGIGPYQISRDSIDHYPRLIPEGGIPLFFIHLSIGILSSITLIVLLIVTLKRRGTIGLRQKPNTSLD
ncbi:MAG: right-handed parallel beta-helix repeat-containing protein [Candidatus Thorarchaeota archaeon]|nr:right-handed parallel beta-helix repeat-containing protein [Candidatus Thorarchaeota archaeon]